jgi:cell division septal protein FtsQ
MTDKEIGKLIREREEALTQCRPPIPDYEIMEKRRKIDYALWFAMTFLGGVAMAFIIVILLIDLKTI